MLVNGRKFDIVSVPLAEANNETRLVDQNLIDVAASLQPRVTKKQAEEEVLSSEQQHTSAHGRFTLFD